MKFELSALKQLQFKKPVSVKIPLEEVDEKGETKYGFAHFIGRFRQQSEEQVNAMKERIQALTDNVNKAKGKAEEEDAPASAMDDAREAEETALEELKALNKEKMSTIWLGFEKHPEHDLPFMEQGNEMASTPQNIANLLDASIVASAVSTAFIEEMNPGMNKVLEGNSKR